ncbi:MAG: glycosyltransferase, partial [Nitrososphaeraceae archaeon]
MLRLTIGIPSYNEGGKIISLIKSVCESALNCDGARISEIIVCDHSSDSTPQILATFMAQHRYPMIRLVH